MRQFQRSFYLAVLLVGLGVGVRAQQTYLGMDRNDYPGDANMAVLHKMFAFTG